MTILTYGASIPSYKWIPEYFEPNDTARIIAATATLLRWTNSDGTVVSINGTGFVYDGTVAIDGIVSSITVRSGATTLLSATQVKGDLATLFDFAFGFEREGQSNQNASGFDFMTALLRGNDTINGSANGDDVIGGRNPGNDTINANGGDDFIKGDAGRDTMNGGADFDTLTYQETFYDPTAYRGIVVNVALGTILDSWGFTDSFTGIEEFQGSRFRDTFNGGDDDDRFHGLKGNDVINGGGGFDEIMYWKDAEFGGKRGIIVDLAAGTIKDGWGNTDTVTGIESVIGTGKADSFAGSAINDQFLGGAGIDSYNGGAGKDTVNFSWGPANTGAVVNLALASGQVLNDGFGNVETLTSIERIDGNELDDNFQGNALANDLVGDRGNDTLNGRGGNDFIQGDAGQDILTGGTGTDEFRFDKREGNDPWGDTITDFVSGTDRITIYTPDFADQGMDGILRFVNGTAAGGTGSWFFFNTANKGLFWDADGIGAGAAVLVATLTNVASLQTSDIELFI